MLDWLVTASAAVGAGSLVGATLLALFPRLQGDCRIRLLPERLALLEREAEPGRLRLRFQMPIVNAGRQKGMVVEILPRSEYCPGLHKEIWLAIKCHLAEQRNDGYWQAILMKAGQAGTLETAIQLTGPQPVLRRLIAGGTLPLVFYCKVIGRGGTVWLLQEVAAPLTPRS